MCFPDIEAEDFPKRYETDEKIVEEFAEYQTNKIADKAGNFFPEYDREDVGVGEQTVVRIKRKGRICEDGEFMSEGLLSMRNVGGVAHFDGKNEDGKPDLAAYDDNGDKKWDRYEKLKS